LHAATRAEIVVPDQLCLPGEAVFVEAFLQRSGLLGRIMPGIQGELLEWFDADGQRLASLLTDASGHARFAYRPDRPGTASFQVRLSDNPRVHAEPASGRVFVRKPGRPLFFVTVEGALRQEEKPRGPFVARQGTAEPLAGAQQTLTRAQACSTPVYLTALPRTRLDEVRRWLGTHSFPEAPVLLLESAPDPKQPGSFTLETDLFASLRDGHPAPAVLVTGNRELAALASDEGVDVYLLVDEGPSRDAPEKTPRIRPAAGWEEVPPPCGL